MRHGEIWDAAIPAPVGKHPVLILSRDSMPSARQEITVEYCTSNVRNRPFEVLLTPAEDGVFTICVANFDSINTVRKKWLVKRIGAIHPSKWGAVKAAISAAFDLP